MRKEVATSYPIKCVGAPPRDDSYRLTADISSVEASLTIYKDGNRDVGCTFLSNELCNRFGISDYKGRCKHLFPEESKK